ncbi:MAG: hypothetical protein HWD61_02020 [Parachlamydiaceae bacterium]|nr:MAG: hypothetical protein HWD61_02020 [Parachlamydiaceae bacterium]
MKNFIENLFGLIAVRQSIRSSSQSNVLRILSCGVHFNAENTLLVLKSLCYAESPFLLVQILDKSEWHPKIIEAILKINPQEDEEDLFFQDFLEEIAEFYKRHGERYFASINTCNPPLKNLSDYVMEKESPRRQDLIRQSPFSSPASRKINNLLRF